MEIHNLSSESFILSGRRRLVAGSTLTIDDAVFLDDTSMQTQIESLLEDGAIEITVAPVGWAVIGNRIEQVRAGHHMQVVQAATLEEVGHEYDVDLTTLVTMVPPDGARFVLVQALGDNARWGGDPDDPPSSGRGTRLFEDSEFVYPGDLTKFQIIGESAAATANFVYFA